MKRVIFLTLAMLLACAPRASAQFVSDTFTDTDGTDLASHTGGTGATWTNDDLGDALTITSGAVYNTGAGSAAYHASGTPSGADYSVQANFVYLSQTGAIGITGRAVASGTAGHVNGYMLQHRAFHGWQLMRLDTGAPTQLGVDVGPELTTADNKVGKLEFVGSTINAYVDGSLIITVTDTTYSAAGNVGIFGVLAVTSTTGVHVDNVSASNGGGGGGGSTKPPSLMLLGVGD